MSNEPVAWMLTLPDGTHDWILDGNGCKGYIPLYTYPAKTLTDEEIAEIYHSENRFSPKGNFAYYGFARAILKKAQEK